MKSTSNKAKRALVGMAIAGAFVGSAGVAMAQDSGSSSSTGSAPSSGNAARAAETPLTGDEAAKVQAAALAANPGASIVRLETDSDGSPYEAHIVTTDGSRVTLKFDASFAVTATEQDGAGGGRSGGRGPGGAHAAETALTGDVAEKVKAAALAAEPGVTVDRVESDSDGSPYEAHITRADGSKATLKVNESFQVTATEAN